MTYDVIIVGGGPGGSTLASVLALRGKSVLVLEAERFPRFHIGESLLPMSCELFDELGLKERMEARFLRKYGAKFFCSDSGRTNEYLFTDAYQKRFQHAYQVPRADFDDLLLERAGELGAEVRQEWTASEVVFDGERAVGVRARPVGDMAGTVELRARFVVDGTGRSTLLASRFGVKRRLPGLDQSAMFGHYRDVPRGSGQDEGHIWVVVFRHGWFWFIPFKDGRTSVGVVVSRAWMKERSAGETLEDFKDRTFAESEVARELMAKSVRLSEVGTTADFSYSVSRFAGDGWLCVGDACGFIDPLFSTGAHLAIKGAHLAADTIETALARPEEERAARTSYEERVRSAAGLFLGAVQSFYRGELRELLFDQPQRKPIRQLITSMLSGDVFHAPGKAPAWVSYLRQQYPARFA